MILLIIPIIGVAVVFYGRVIKNLSKEVQDALADVLPTFLVPIFFLFDVFTSPLQLPRK